MVTIGAGPFCESGRGASVADGLLAATERQFVRADAITRKVGQCTRSCAASQSKAVYCAYGGRLIADRYGLAVIGLRTSELVELYGRAERQGAGPLQVLGAEVVRYGDEALAVLWQARRALAEPGAIPFPILQWQAGETEIIRLSGMVSLLVDLDLMQGDARTLQRALVQAAAGFRTVREDLEFSRGNATITPRPKPSDLQERMTSAATQLAFAIASLEASLADRKAAEHDRRTIVPSGDPEALRETIGCLNRLTLSALRGSEAAERSTDTLNTCRSFDGCGGPGSNSLPANLSSLTGFLDSREEAEKATQAFLSTLCSAG